MKINKERTLTERVEALERKTKEHDERLKWIEKQIRKDK